MFTKKKFASQADLEEKKISFTKLTESAYAYTAEGDPNTGIVIGDDSVMVIDTQATPVMAQDVIRHIREVTDKPIKYVTLSHYHAVRVLGASAYNPQQIIASQDTYDLIVERGEFDKASEIGRFPRLFQNVESVPEGLTWPTLTFTGKMTLWLGKLEVQLLQVGRGHTKGDTIVWLPAERILFSGDLVEFDATPYAGDAYFTDWPQTLSHIAALQPEALVELVAFLGCLALAWLLVRLWRGQQSDPRSIWFGHHIVDGVLFPVLALAAHHSCTAWIPKTSYALPSCRASCSRTTAPSRNRWWCRSARLSCRRRIQPMRSIAAPSS